MLVFHQCPLYFSLFNFCIFCIFSCIGSARGLSVSLSLITVPVVGENISFAVTVTNHGSVLKTVREYVNAQAKHYDCSPSDTFWEADNIIQLAPNGSMCLCEKCVR